MVKNLITLVHGGKLKYCRNLLWYCSNLCGVLTLENVGTAVKSSNIFIILAPCLLSAPPGGGKLSFKLNEILCENDTTREG
jgi:hypothetical protein